jgi:hypothetical protein
MSELACTGIRHARDDERAHSHQMRRSVSNTGVIVHAHTCIRAHVKQASYSYMDRAI